MTFPYPARAVIVVIVAVGVSGCAWYIEPQKRAMIDIMTQVDLNHQAIIHSNQAPANCSSSTVGDQFVTTCTKPVQ
jgi:hypothetical protein